MWVRNSSLVGVSRVTIVGVSGPDAQQIRSALAVAARNMTTLNVKVSKLRTAVAPFPLVKDLRVSTSFPHGIRIRVIEQLAVATILAGRERMTVAGDGTLLRDVAPSPALPVISVPALPGGSKLTDPSALQAVDVLAAAPYQLLGHVEAVTTSGTHGVVVRLRSGPSLYFGDRDLLTAKWIAAAGVLADSGSRGASYIDVSDPERPAAGAAGATPASSAAGAAGATPASSTSAGGAATSTGVPSAASGTMPTTSSTTTPGG
jgi:cell division protein FtsQ